MYGITEFSWWALLGSLVFGIFGFYAMVRGFKRRNWPVFLAGLILVVYPSFTMNDYVIWLVGLALTALIAFLEKREKKPTAPSRK